MRGGRFVQRKGNAFAFRRIFSPLLSSRWIQARRNMSWGWPLAPFAVAAVCSVCCLTISTAPCCTQPSPACRRSCWAPLHSDENPSAAAPSRMPPAPLLSPSPAQLTLPRARLRRTRGIKCTLGAQRNEHKKTHAPRHQFIFTLATPSGISRSCSHLLKSPQNPCRLESISEPRIQDNKGNSSPAY